MKTILRRLLRARAAGRARVLVRARGSGTASGGGGGFAAPDIYGATTTFNDPANDGVWRSYTTNDPPGQFPNAYWHQASATGGRGGSRCLYSLLPSTGYGPGCALTYTPRSRVFIRFYFRTSTLYRSVQSHNVKWVRFQSAGSATNNGGLHLEQPAIWSDEEAQSVQVDMGWWWGACPAGIRSYYRSLPGGGSWEPQFENRADGQWHSIEMEYDRNAGGGLYVEQRIWMDNQPVVLPNGASNRDGGSWSEIQLVGGNAATDTPTTFRYNRPQAPQQPTPTVTSGFSFFETISAAPNNVWDMYIDDVAVSSQRIGP